MGRLIKNEIKSTAHSMVGIYAATIVSLGLLVIAMLAGIKWLQVFSAILILIVPFLLVFITVISVIRNYASSLFGREGYLSHALPVKGGTLLASKTLVSVVWMVSSYFVMLATFIGGFYYIAVKAESNDTLIMIKELLATFIEAPTTGATIGAVFFVALSFFLQELVFVADVYFSITLANTRPFQSHSVFWAIAFSFLFVVPTYILATYLTNVAPLSFILIPDNSGFIPEAMNIPKELSNYAPTTGWSLRFGVAGMLFQLLSSAALLYFTAYMLNKKTNVK
ncbi:MAG: hypothetical protein LBQ80_03545 [Clostridium sp.]|jgi:hypothetical protein|nr:hypothetical protein [Clostridium sp.]